MAFPMNQAVFFLLAGNKQNHAHISRAVLLKMAALCCYLCPGTTYKALPMCIFSFNRLSLLVTTPWRITSVAPLDPLDPLLASGPLHAQFLHFAQLFPQWVFCLSQVQLESSLLIELTSLSIALLAPFSFSSFSMTPCLVICFYKCGYPCVRERHQKDNIII